MRPVLRRSLVGAGLTLVSTLALSSPAFAGDDGADHRSGAGGTLLRADLVGSLTTDPVLFGVRPGGVDWTVSRSTVDVRTSGRFDAKVRSLLVTATQANPVPTISASLVCNGQVVDTVGPVPFDAAGNARIRGTFDVPARCLTPAVLLNPLRVGTYIAASGLG